MRRRSALLHRPRGQMLHMRKALRRLGEQTNSPIEAGKRNTCTGTNNWRNERDSGGGTSGIKPRAGNGRLQGVRNKRGRPRSRDRTHYLKEKTTSITETSASPDAPFFIFQLF